MITLTDLEAAGAACVLVAIAFMLGHAAGYWRAKDVERRHRELAAKVTSECVEGHVGQFFGARYCSKHGGFTYHGFEVCSKSPTTNTRKEG